MAGTRRKIAAVKNAFIVIESIDAAGGSTQAHLLAQHLKREGYTPHQFHFPQEDAPTGQTIYGKFLHTKNKGKLSRREQALLYIQDFFAGSEAIKKILAHKTGKHIAISDRFCTSTMAYQTIGLAGSIRSRMLKWIAWLCWEGEPQLPKPDLVLLLDLPTDISLPRLNSRTNKHKKDYFENRKKQQAIRSSYMRLAKEQGWVIIDCANKKGEGKTRQEIHRDVWQAVRKLLG